jgi:hypothetical protein
MKNHPVLWFYVLAFAVAWLGWLPMVAGSRGIAPFNHPIIPMLLLLPAVGPGLAAIIVMAATEGKASVNRLLKPLVQWRVGARLLVIAVIAPALLLLAAQIVTQVLGLTATPGLPTDNLIGMVIAVFVMAVFFQHLGRNRLARVCLTAFAAAAHRVRCHVDCRRVMGIVASAAFLLAG